MDIKTRDRSGKADDPAGFLDLEQVLELAPREAAEPFPEKRAQDFQIFGAMESQKAPVSRLHMPVDYGPREQKILAEWYRSAPEPVAEDDGLDHPETASKQTFDLSIAGVQPAHVGFQPVPAMSLIDRRLRNLIEPLQDKVMTNRFQVLHPTMRYYPWCTIGKIFRSYPPHNSEIFVGTGFMFGGRVMMTARHVFPANIHDSFAWGARWRFSPGHDGTANQPEPFGSAYITTVRGKKQSDGILWDTISGSDYAACRLLHRIGDLSGSMGVYCFGDSDSYKNKYFNSAGYPDFNNYNPVQEILCKIRDVDGGYRERELETTNFAGPGWSGGPLFGYLNASGDTRVVGVCSGKEMFDSFLPPFSNLVFAGGKRFVELAQYTVDNWWD